MTPHEVQHHPFQYFDFNDRKQVARTLTRLPRFCGHGINSLSVGHHLLHCLDIGRNQGYNKRMQTLLLMHDIPEVFYGDIPTYVKKSIGEPYYDYAHKIDRDLFDHYAIPYYTKSEKDTVKVVDNTALFYEADFIFGNSFNPDDWPTPSILPNPWTHAVLDMEIEGVYDSLLMEMEDLL